MTAWVVWCIGDTTGVLTVVPAVLTFTALIAREQSAREALEQSEHKYRTIAGRSLEMIDLLTRAVEQTADSVVIADREGTIEFVNPAFEATTGYSRAEALGRTPRILKSGVHDKDFYTGLWNQLLKGEGFHGTLVNRKKSGELYWAEQTITPIKDGSGRITHFVSVLKDMTEFRKRQEQEVQLRLARGVQQRFYDGAARAVDGFDVATVARPAVENGGDYVDVFTLQDGRVCVGIGDVSGHGLDSAMVMALTRAYVRSFAQGEENMAQILGKVNRMLCTDLEENRFVTLLLVCLDRASASLSYANAGHVPGFLITPRGQVECALESSGPPLGLFPDCRFSTSIVPLTPHQLVILTTDGITEMAGEGDEQFGTAGILEYVRAHAQDTAHDLAEGLYRAARNFAGNNPQSDDITEVVIRVS
jgi:sigma-B regulation protein RsbU (phosphoserine phosphatase)